MNTPPFIIVFYRPAFGTTQQNILEIQILLREMRQI